MATHSRIEIAVGAFLLAGLAALAYLSVAIAGVRIAPRPHYLVTARFSSVGALREGATVAIAGVPVGRVHAIGLASYQADTALEIDRNVELPADTIASIRTLGLLGETYVSLSPGASEQHLAPGGRIAQTEPAIDLADLVGRFAFDRPTGGGTSDPLEK
jgi:phospholipid/cholesterol/gamma-HCH transport system substrate-binding protein